MLDFQPGRIKQNFAFKDQERICFICIMGNGKDDLSFGRKGKTTGNCEILSYEGRTLLSLSEGKKRRGGSRGRSAGGRENTVFREGLMGKTACLKRKCL